MKYNKFQKSTIQRYVRSVNHLEEIKKIYSSISFKSPYQDGIIKALEECVRINFESCVGMGLYPSK